MTQSGMSHSAAVGGKPLPSRAWSGAMIAPLTDAGRGAQASFVAQDFSVDAVGPTVLHISAQGLYRCYINGLRVGDDLMTPGWTCYDDRIAYQSYEIGNLLKAGKNRIEIWLGDGWYRSQMMWAAAPIYNCWGDRIAAIADMEGETMLISDKLDFEAIWQKK